MKKQPTITLKRILKRHKENTQDAELHKIIESENTDDKKFDALLRKATKHEAFDKKD